MSVYRSRLKLTPYRSVNTQRYIRLLTPLKSRNLTIARGFPFIVEIGVPPGGLGKRLNAMHAFHNQRGIQVAHVRHRHEDDRDLLLWCFARRAIAEEFAAEFGGSLVG